MIELVPYLLMILFIAIIVNLGIALYGIFYKPHLTKKIISLTILGDTANTLAILIGYRRWVSSYSPSKPPVYTNWTEHSKHTLELFVKQSVDPLPQALVLTAIVIGLAVNLFLVFLALQIYRMYGTLDMREIRKLRG